MAAIFRAYGFEVRGLEGAGDHLCITVPRGDALIQVRAGRSPVVIHSEVKRQERLQIWQWLAQLEAEAPPGTLPLLSFRRSRSPWYAAVQLERLVERLA